MEQARSPELRHNLQVMEAMRDSMKSVRRWWQGPDTGLQEKETVVLNVLTDRIGSVQAKAFVTEQTGIDDDSGWAISQEDLDTLPPRAIARLKEAIDNRTRNLWPILLLNQPDQQEHLNRYLNAAHGAAQLLGCFPYEPTPESITNQRIIPHKHRELFAQLLYFQTLFTFHTPYQASLSHLSMLQRAIDVYTGLSLPDLQQTLTQKASLSHQVIEEFTKSGLWDNPEQLALMCVDRGLRTVVVDYYPQFRSVKIPSPGTGYHTGQVIEITTSQLRDMRTDLGRQILRTI